MRASLLPNTRETSFIPWLSIIKVCLSVSVHPSAGSWAMLGLVYLQTTYLPFVFCSELEHISNCLVGGTGTPWLLLPRVKSFRYVRTFVDHSHTAVPVILQDSCCPYTAVLGTQHLATLWRPWKVTLYLWLSAMTPRWSLLNWWKEGSITSNQTVPPQTARETNCIQWLSSFRAWKWRVSEAVVPHFFQKPLLLHPKKKTLTKYINQICGGLTVL